LKKSCHLRSARVASDQILRLHLQTRRSKLTVTAPGQLTRFEVTVLATQGMIDALADRIERAYALRRPRWLGGCSTPRVWSVAATVLWGVHRDDPALPTDPELFVAAQPTHQPYPDPWYELARDESAQRYRRRVHTIVRTLRRELSGEVKLAEQLIDSGQAIGRVLRSRNGRISPLGRFIVARRAGRLVLARRFAGDAADQHWSCPLYREASRRLLPPGVYPVPDNDGAMLVPPTSRRLRIQIHRN
jgi:hypothetical protein